MDISNYQVPNGFRIPEAQMVGNGNLGVKEFRDFPKGGVTVTTRRPTAPVAQSLSSLMGVHIIKFGQKLKEIGGVNYE